MVLPSDFLKKRIEESRGEKITLVAADKGGMDL